MPSLRVAILGLDKLGLSVALRLQTYTAKGGKHRFELIGHDSRDDYEKPARKRKVLDKVERKIQAAVNAADIVIMNLPFEDLQPAYQSIATSLRDGVLILDAATIKQPSLAWAKQFLSHEHHLIGFTPAVNPSFMFEHQLSPEYATDQFFLDSPIFLTPSVSSMKEAIDLAVNFSHILGGKPHFLDPAEHDSLTTLVEELPQLLSIAAYTTAMRHQAWNDAQRLANPPFNVLTRYLLTHHPDALRDEWLANSPSLARALDDLLAILTDLRNALIEKDQSAIEAFIIAASDDYQEWINKRHKNDFREQQDNPLQFENTIAGTLFGGAITKRIFGHKNDSK